ncbi:MAG: hypothetical protein PHR43_03960 [Dehalococcoidales bacterium]|nr:hypothetical protein [Dehalococcoidales bacterium]
MQIRKSYREVNPELLSAEIKDFIIKQGASPGEAKLETYTLPDESANFISRTTMTFNAQSETAIRAHIVGSVRTETKMMLDIEDKLFPKDKVDALMADLDFIFGSYEVKD